MIFFFCCFTHSSFHYIISLKSHFFLLLFLFSLKIFISNGYKLMECPRISKFFLSFSLSFRRHRRIIVIFIITFVAPLLCVILSTCKCIRVRDRVKIYKIFYHEHCINVFFKVKEIFFFFSSSLLAVALVNENVSSSTAHIKLQYGIYTNEE